MVKQTYPRWMSCPEVTGYPVWVLMALQSLSFLEVGLELKISSFPWGTYLKFRAAEYSHSTFMFMPCISIPPALQLRHSLGAKSVEKSTAELTQKEKKFVLQMRFVCSFGGTH